MNDEQRIIVRGANVLDKPLLETSQAKVVEFYGSDGQLNALLIKGILSPDLWMFANKLDEDWQQVLIRFGYADIKPEELRAIREGL